MRKIFVSLCLFIFCISAFCVSVEDTLGTIPSRSVQKPSNLKNDFFIINGEFYGNKTEKDYNLLNKYGLNIVWALSKTNFANNVDMNLLNDLKIPFFIQNNGNDFSDYLKEKDALDYTWGDLNPNRKCNDAMGNLLSMPHPATRDLWKNYIKVSVFNGANGYIFPQQSVPQEFGKGSGGFNPYSIAMFRQDLMGRDEGIQVNINGEEKVFKFKDYVNYYLGFMPEAKSFGLRTWDSYYPTRKANYDPEGYKLYEIINENPPAFYAFIDSKTKKDYIPDFLLRDMLIHYEALKFTDELGKNAAEFGGVYYSMPQYESMANGNDMLFMSALTNVQGVFENNSYTKADYLTLNSKNTANKKLGYILEENNFVSYPKYDANISFIKAYEGKIINNAQICDSGIWPDEKLVPSAKDFVNAEKEFKKTIIAYANGFKYASADKAEKLPAEFTYVVSRNIFRPWDNISADFSSTEEMMYKNGYVFKTVGFEDAENLKGEMVVWNADTAPIDKFTVFWNKLKEGIVTTGIMIAPYTTKVLSEELKVAQLKDYFPQLQFDVVMDAKEGLLPVKIKGKDYEINGGLWSVKDAKTAMMSEDGVPLLYKVNVGKGILYILPFNPVSSGVNEQIAKYVFDVVFNRSSIFPKFENINGSNVNVFKDSKGLVVSLANKIIVKPDINKFTADNKTDKRLAEYVIGEPTEAKIRVEKANTPYFVYNYFEGDPIQIISDSDRYISIKSENKSLSLFYVREKEDVAFGDELKVRREEFGHLLNLDTEF